jgi:hypothetical protein
MPDAMLATPPCAGLRDERAALPSPRAALGMASPPWPARDVRPPPRVSVLRGMIALWKPSLLSLPAASGQRGLAQRMRSPARRVPLPASRMAAIGPFLLLAVLQASPHRSQPSATYTYLSQLACSLTQRMRISLSCAFPAAATHLRIPVALSASLCACCGGDAPDQVTFGLLPCAALLPRSCSGRCAYVRLCCGNRSQPLPHCGGG